MNKSTTIVGAFSNKGSNVFRETFQHSTKDVTHYFPGHMAKGERTNRCRESRPCPYREEPLFSSFLLL